MDQALSLCDEVADPDEGEPRPRSRHLQDIEAWPEAFLVFSRPAPSQNLGFVDPRAAALELSIGGRDFSIAQSPGVLTSNRKGGTTGAGGWFLNVKGIHSEVAPEVGRSRVSPPGCSPKCYRGHVTPPWAPGRLIRWFSSRMESHAGIGIVDFHA